VIGEELDRATRGRLGDFLLGIQKGHPCPRGAGHPADARHVGIERLRRHLDDLDLVAALDELVRGGHAGDAGADHHDALLVALAVRPIGLGHVDLLLS